MELLILKSGREYIRFKDNGYLLVSLDKASVFPLDRINAVQEHEAYLKKKGFHNIRIKKLVLTEEDL
ncbi:MAG: hypothetical protein GXP56_03585 [Deltaproteobacteria bacterium]|nr:hypothetical protein [Deltaproteobacteria bacterium]